MTYGIAYSIGLDAANRQMHSAGRTAWNEDDAELAAATLNRHFRSAPNTQASQLKSVDASGAALRLRIRYKACSGECANLVPL